MWQSHRLAYVGPIATAFAYWAAVEAGRHFRASTLSMALLATPPLGIVISAWTAHESIDRSLVAGCLLIGLGIVLSTWRIPPARASAVTSRA